MSRRIGLIGAGLMGHGIALNILKGGFELTVLAHRNRAPVEDLVGHGAREAVSPAEVAAASDVLFTCLPNSDVVETVLLGPGGAIEGARPNLVVVDLTTGRPSATTRLGATLAGHGVRLLDGPVTLTPKEALEGRLNLLIGGEPAVIEELRPLFETFSARIFPTGPLGSAHTLKLVNNFLTMGGMALAVEAITTALRAGVEPRMMRELVMVSGGASTAFERISTAVTGEDPGSGGAFAIGNALKDVRYFNELEDADGVLPIMGDAARQFFQLAVALGFGDQHLPRLFEVQERLLALRPEARSRGGTPQG